MRCHPKKLRGLVLYLRDKGFDGSKHNQVYRKNAMVY